MLIDKSGAQVEYGHPKPKSSSIQIEWYFKLWPEPEITHGREDNGGTPRPLYLFGLLMPESFEYLNSM